MKEFDNIFTVFEVTSHIKNMLENNIDILKIEGEVSNLSTPASGHIYFSLKDERSIIRCVYFGVYQKKNSFQLKNGDRVVVTGKITIYERDGQYQILVSSVSQYGIGVLHERFEMLKKKLEIEGLFKVEFKKKLPKYPEAIGIITSETGAALQDIINILSRRYPLKICVFHSIVQGNEAAKSLNEGIKYFSEKNNVDVIIIGRGGGSYEDLYCFNDETLARSIHACTIPIISAVGHETDFTICDFVADVRAATPSAAAEIATPNKSDLLNILHSNNKQIRTFVSTNIRTLFNNVVIKESKLKTFDPCSVIQKYQQHIDIVYLKMTNFCSLFNHTRIIVEHKNEKICFIINERMSNIKRDILKKQEILNAISPIKILEKGFSLVIKENQIIKSIADLQKSNRVKIMLRDGHRSAEIID